jgi:hypothetical protein
MPKKLGPWIGAGPQPLPGSRRIHGQVVRLDESRSLRYSSAITSVYTSGAETLTPAVSFSASAIFPFEYAWNASIAAGRGIG